MGCLFSGTLAEAGFDVTILDHRNERQQLIKTRGVIIEEPQSRRITVHPEITCDPQQVGEVDAILVCVKSYDTEGVGTVCESMAKPETMVVTLQNGVGNVDRLRNALTKGSVVAGITSHGATVLEDGVIRHAGVGDTFLGLVSGSAHKLPALGEAFRAAGFDNKIVGNINDLIWSKLLVNVGINALSALTRLLNGELILNRDTEILLEKAVLEAIEVGKREGVSFLYDDPVGQVKKVCELTSANVSSMLQDVLRRKKTEVEFINGAIVERGAAQGVPTPYNEALTRLVRSLQDTYDKQLL